MTVRVTVQPKLLHWACARTGQTIEAFAKRFPKLEAWTQEDAKPTLKQLESFAKATRTPVGYFFLPEPPEESVPIPDLRTMGNEHIDHPSADLLDTVYVCQQRQEWFRDYARSSGSTGLEFVGSAKRTHQVEKTAEKMRHALGFDLDARQKLSTWSEALRQFMVQADSIGVLVMVNGIVGSNTHRKLDPEEFRGFALADEYAPVVFINGADTKAAQMFTLAHELAHIWLGESALTDVGPASTPSNEIEIWCNEVAAELLAPLALVKVEYDGRASLRTNLDKLARRFKVSTLVVLRRIHDAGHLGKQKFWRAYETELKRLHALGAKKQSSGGDYYPTQSIRVGKRFAAAVIVRTLEGQTGYRDAFRMLGCSKIETFNKLAQHLGVI